MTTCTFRLCAAFVAMIGCSQPTLTTEAIEIFTGVSETGWWTIEIKDEHGAVVPLDPEREDDGEDEPGIIVIKADVFFDHNSSTITSAEVEPLEAVAAMIIVEGRAVMIVGHTDDSGTRTYNYQLGLARADSIRRHLVSINVPARLVLAADSQGEDCPSEPNDTPQGRSANRRVEIYQPDHAPDCR